MGSWLGHVDEAVFFLLIGIWWMLRFFPKYIRSQWTKEEYTAQLSFGLPGKPHIPIEAILKTVFPICGFLGETFSCGLALTDENGNFRKVSQMHHMTIYGIFIIHGLIDILMSCHVPLPRGLDYLSAAVCFIWYAQAFSMHAHMPGKAGMEEMVHTLPIWVMYVMVAAIIVEYWRPHSFAPQLVRIWCINVLGTWFYHIAFIMYIPLPLPGSEPNPAWDRTDDRNVHFTVAAFGMHVNMNLAAIVIVYLTCYGWLKMRGADRFKFIPLTTDVNAEDHLVYSIDEK